MPRAGPRSQWACGSKSNTRGSPQVRTTTLSAALLPDRHRGVRQVRQRRDDLGALRLDALELDLELLDRLAARLVRLEDGRGVELLALRLRDLVGGRVLLALQPFDLRNQAPPVRFEAGQLLELCCGVEAAVGVAGAHGLEIVADEGGIQHGTEALVCILLRNVLDHPQGRVPRRRSRHALPPSHQGAAEGDAARSSTSRSSSTASRKPSSRA